MALSADIQTGILGGLVVNGITKAAVPVKAVLYPDFVRLADLPGGADVPGALIVGYDPATPLVTIADTSVAADTSADLWGYVCDGSGQFEITLIGDGPEINPKAFTYRLVVTTVDESVTYYDGSVNVPAGSTMWLSALPVKTTASPGANRTTVNLTTGGGGGGTVDSWSDVVAAPDFPNYMASGSTQEAARAAIGAGTGSSDLELGTTSSTAKAGDYQPTWTQVTSKPATFTPSAHTHTLSEIAGTTAFGQSLVSAATPQAGRTTLGFSSVGESVATATDGAAARTAIGITAPTWTEVTGKPTDLVTESNLRLPIVLTQSAYDALTPPVAGQVYIIQGA